MSIDRKPRTYRRRTTIGGQFAPRLVEMLESPAWRVLSLAAHRVLDRLDIEHRHHGGRDNGKLTVTYLDFEHYGIARNQIAPALREVEALGFIEITQRGRAGNAEHRTPHKFRLTSYDTEHAKGTNEWRQIATIEDAERIAQQARNRTQPKHSPHPISDKSHPGNRVYFRYLGMGCDHTTACSPGGGWRRAVRERASHERRVMSTRWRLALEEGVVVAGGPRSATRR